MGRLLQQVANEMAVESVFPEFLNLNSAVTVLGFCLAYIKYRYDRNKDDRERQAVREANIEKDTTRYTEQKAKLDLLLEFHRDQMQLNSRRDEQISQLQRQTVALEEIARGVHRRLVMLEGGGPN